MWRYPTSSIIISLSVDVLNETLSLEDFLREVDWIPITRFSLEFKALDIFTNPSIQKFLQRYGDQIEYLAMSDISIPMEDDEIKFYENLPNLTSLSVRKSHGYGRRREITLPEFPVTFKNVKSLRLLNHHSDTFVTSFQGN